MRLTSPSYYKDSGATVRECKWVSELSAASVAEISFPAEFRIKVSLFVYGSLAVSLQVVDGLQCRAESQTADDSAADYAGLVRNAPVYLCAEKTSIHDQ